jgi:hypothetical protein
MNPAPRLPLPKKGKKDAAGFDFGILVVEDDPHVIEYHNIIQIHSFPLQIFFHLQLAAGKFTPREASKGVDADSRDRPSS